MQAYIIVNRDHNGPQYWGSAAGSTPQEALEAHIHHATGEHAYLLRKSGPEGLEFFVGPVAWSSSPSSVSLTGVRLFRVKPTASYTVEAA